MVVSRISVHGIGAVSPAGWTVDSMRDALAKGEPLPIKELSRPGWPDPFRVRRVPPPASRPDFLAHSRLRRASPITQFLVSAAIEALGEDRARVADGELKLGIVLSVMAGCVNYSSRFYSETLSDPATASPLVFPETVFNAPASHAASLLGSTGPSYTLVGDPGMFLVGLSMAADWLREGSVDSCLVIGAEEADWLVADAYRRFYRGAVVSEGAGAVYLRVGTDPGGIELAAISDPILFRQGRSREQVAQEMRAQMLLLSPDALLCDGQQGLGLVDRAERLAWADWKGSRISPKMVLGEGLAAGSAWQCVAGADALREERYSSAHISVVGCNQQAIGASFVRT